MKIEVKEQIKDIVDLCLDKKLFCDINTEVMKISVYNFNDFCLDSYFDGELYNSKNIIGNRTVLLSELLQSVKNY